METVAQTNLIQFLRSTGNDKIQTTLENSKFKQNSNHPSKRLWIQRWPPLIWHDDKQIKVQPMTTWSIQRCAHNMNNAPKSYKINSDMQSN